MMKNLNSNRRVSRRSVSILAATSTLGVLLAACGSQSTTSDTTETATTSASASASATTETSAAPVDLTRIVAESAKTTETLRSVHIDLKATDVPSLQVESVNADVTSIEPGNGQAVGSASFRLRPDQPFTPTDFLVTNKVFYTKAPDGSWQDLGPAPLNPRPVGDPRPAEGTGSGHPKRAEPQGRWTRRNRRR